jgi:uncharacterized lipoprotein YddW (UPF0748 family)
MKYQSFKKQKPILGLLKRLKKLAILLRFLLSLKIMILIGISSCSITGYEPAPIIPDAQKRPTNSLDEKSGSGSIQGETIYNNKNQFDRSDLRGIWIQAESISSKEKIDETINRVEAGDLNAVFALVFFNGQTMYESDVAKKHWKVEPNFNPLAYLVSKAHHRGIQVHAWFVMGLVGEGENSPLSENPDWALIGPDGKTTGWLNFTRPDVQQYITELMIEVVEEYGVDGLHFDYLRYPGSEWGFDSYSIDLFGDIYGINLNEMRFNDLPAYSEFEGNPLILPGNAQVLAKFVNGLPAVTLNSYGEGEVILLNWNASKRKTAIGSEIIARSLKRMLKSDENVYVFRSETNIKEYGDGSYENGLTWLSEIGFEPSTVNENEIDQLSPGSVVVLPNIYLMSDQTASQLAIFVNSGGGLIFVDGPTRSIFLPEIQSLTGMNMRGRYYKMDSLMVATKEHPIVPTSDRSQVLEEYRELDENWKSFRKERINQLIHVIYQRIKSEHPQVTISVTVTEDQESADREVLQDWQSWLAGEYIDLLIPRFYVEQVGELDRMIRDWQPVWRDYQVGVPGIKSYYKEDGSKIFKSPHQIIEELKRVESSLDGGFLIFDLDNLTDEQLQSLTEKSK